MIISHRWEFVYLGVPKGASTTMHHWLSQPAFCEERWRPDPADQHSVAIPAAVRSYFTFAAIREPERRAVSLWAHSQTPAAFAIDTWPMTFRDFVLIFQPQASWFYSAGQAELLAPVRLDAVVRVERLEEDLRRLPPIAAVIAAGGELEALPRLNALKHPGRSQLVTPELAAVIADRWAADQQLRRLVPDL